MTSSGSFVEVWNEAALTNNGSFTTTNLDFRTFQESTDTAGALVTDFIDPYTGDPMQNGDTVTDQMNYIVVTFDSDMMTSGTNSVTNPNNWGLLLNGSLVTNGISTIYYGMNEAALNPLFSQFARAGHEQVASRNRAQRPGEQPGRHDRDLFAGRPLPTHCDHGPGRRGR